MVDERLQALADHFKGRLLQESAALADLPRPRLRLALEGLLNQLISDERVIIASSERERLITWILDESTGYGPLEPLLQDPTVSEIMVVRPAEVYVERHGRLEATAVRFRDEAHVRHTIERILAPLGRRLDESSPMVDARLPDGSRVNAVIPPVALFGPALTIRKFRRQPPTLAELVEWGALSEAMAAYLQAAVRGRRNILISGGTGSGKTTLLGALAGLIPPTERLVTIEDMAELRLPRPHVVALEARPPNVEGKGEITIRQLVRNALRMRPDRIIVGEVRGDEALDMLQAMNTGHEGSLTTIHANSPADAFGRLEAMVTMAGSTLPLEAIRQHLVAAIDLVVQTERLPDGQRRLVALAEVVGAGRLVERFVYDREARVFQGAERGVAACSG